MEGITLESLGFTDGARTLDPAVPAGTGKLRTGATTSVEDRALSLLGAGVVADSVASALGVSPSYISQLLSNDAFATKVATIRYENLQKHNVRDDSYDSLEDQLLVKLQQQLPLMMKPETILRAIATINGAKRRGQTAPDSIINNTNIVQLVLPQVITEKFAVNIDNQVTRAGSQELHTIPSGNLLKQVEERQAARQNLLDDSGEVSLNI